LLPTLIANTVKAAREVMAFNNVLAVVMGANMTNHVTGRGQVTPRMLTPAVSEHLCCRNVETLVGNLCCRSLEALVERLCRRSLKP
jgi:hypothetical protein